MLPKFSLFILGLTGKSKLFIKGLFSGKRGKNF